MDGTLKISVVVLSGAPVTVRITPLGRTRARLDFDMAQWRRDGRRVANGDGQRAVRFHACPPGTRRFTDGTLDPWTGYPVGFLVGRPGCARLTVAAAGMRTVRRRVALGVAVSRCGPRAELGEFHGAWNFSPDDSQIAFGSRTRAAAAV